MMTIFSLMSSKRQEQIKKAIKKWKDAPGHHKLKTYCIHGHPYNPENTYNYPTKTKKRTCRMCQKVNSDRYLLKKRPGRNPWLTVNLLTKRQISKRRSLSWQ